MLGDLELKNDDWVKAKETLRAASEATEGKDSYDTLSLVCIFSLQCYIEIPWKTYYCNLLLLIFVFISHATLKYFRGTGTTLRLSVMKKEILSWKLHI